MLCDFKKHLFSMILHDFWPRKCWRQEKKALDSTHCMNFESLYDKDICCFKEKYKRFHWNGRGKFILPKHWGVAKLPGLIEWSNDLKTYHYEPIIIPYSFTGFEQFDIILFIGQIVFWFDKFFNKFHIHYII